MSKIRFLLIVLTLVIAVGAVIGTPLFLDHQRTVRQNQERMKAKTEDMKKNNPALYDNVTKSLQENVKKTQEDPLNQASWIDLGVAYQALGDYINAKKAYSRAINISDQTLIAWNNLVDIYIQEENFVKAEETLKEQIAATKEPAAYLKLAQLYIDGKQGNIQAAKKLLEVGIKETQKVELKEALQRLELTGKL